MKRLWHFLVLCLILFLVSYNLWFFVLREVTRATWREVLLQGGMVVDGTGKEMFGADVLIRDGRVVAVGKGIKAAPGARVVDARGCLLFPGLVQIYDGSLPRREVQEALVASGVTTIACTTDGLRRGGGEPGRAGSILNYGVLLRAAELLEADNPRELAKECLAEGFLGFGLDLDDPRDALLDLRNLPPLMEGILPRPLVVLHPAEEVCSDPQSLLAFLGRIYPAELRGSFELYLRHFRLYRELSQEEVAQIRGWLEKAGVKGDLNPFLLCGEPRHTLEGALGRFPPDALRFADTPPSLRSLQGRTLGEVAREQGVSVAELAAGIKERSGGTAVLVEVVETGSEMAFSSEPYFCWQSPPGFFLGVDVDVPVYLDLLVDERLSGSLEERVRRLTSLPAEMLGIRDRGSITPGTYADLLIVRRTGKGFSLRSVLVNGQPVLLEGKRTRSWPGKMIFRERAGIPSSGENS